MTLPNYLQAFNKGGIKDSPSLVLYQRTEKLLKDISYPGLHFEVAREIDRCQIRVRCPGGVCTETGQHWDWNGRWWRLSYHMTDSEIVATAFKALLTALEHEARESFKYKGVPIYDAHLDVNQLAELRSDRSSLDVR